MCSSNVRVCCPLSSAVQLLLQHLLESEDLSVNGVHVRRRWIGEVLNNVRDLAQLLGNLLVEFGVGSFDGMVHLVLVHEHTNFLHVALDGRPAALQHAFNRFNLSASLRTEGSSCGDGKVGAACGGSGSLQKAG